MTQPRANRFHILTIIGHQYHDHPTRRFGLGRHVNHDPRSRAYAFRTPTTQLVWTFHERHVPIFDQGDLGSCEGNATLGIQATGPYWDALQMIEQQTGLGGRYSWDEDGARQMYSDITADDDIDGQWPPADTGSDGLSAAKECVKRGLIPGYQHTFSAKDALAALQHFPLLMGTAWTDAMFDPDGYGRIEPHGQVAGGHAWILDEYVPAGAPAKTGAILSKTEAFTGGTTSWGTGFGAQGRFYLSVKNLTTLLNDDGDVIVLTPRTAPAPEPTPAPVTDTEHALAVVMRAWLAEHPDL